MNHYKISRELLNIGRKLVIKMNVSLIGDNNVPFLNQYARPDGSSSKSISLTPNAFITFEYKEGTWTKDKSILINELNLVKVVKGFRNMHKNIYNGGIFAQDKNGKVVIYQDRARECTEAIRLGTQNMLLVPAVIEDDSGITYEGIILYINNMSNYVELPIDWFEGLMRQLEKIDMFQYSQLLLNFYISFSKNVEELNNVKIIPTKKDKKTQDKTTGSLVKNDDSLFDGLEV